MTEIHKIDEALALEFSTVCYDFLKEGNQLLRSGKVHESKERFIFVEEYLRYLINKVEQEKSLK